MNAYVVRRADGSYTVVQEPTGPLAACTLTALREIADLAGDRWYVAAVQSPAEYLDACHRELEDVRRWAKEDAQTLQAIARHAVDRYRARQAREVARRPVVMTVDLETDPDPRAR